VVLAFRWAADEPDPSLGLLDVDALERDGWHRVGAHPIYRGSYLLCREVPEDCE